MLAYCKHGVKSEPFNGFLAGKPLLGLWRANALHQLEQDALADAAVGDAQPADRPGGADRIEDGAAAQYQIGALAADAGIGGAAFDVEPGEMARHQLDLIEGQHAAVDKGADIARQGEMHPGEGRDRAGATE